MTCSNTEIVTALGCADWLVGVDDYSDFPAEVVAGLPRVGPDLGIDVERVAALEPDLVLASLTVPGHEQVVERVRAAGLPFLAPAPKSIGDVYRDVLEIGAALGVVERARAVVAKMKEALEPTNDAVGSFGAESTGAVARPRLLIQWWPKPIIAPGRLSWVQDLIDRAGGENPLAAEEVESRPLTDEEAASMAPDALVLAWCGVEPHKVRPEVVERNPALKDLAAVRQGHLYCVPEAWLGRPSPRLVHGLAALREVVAAVQGRLPEERRAELRRPRPVEEP